MNNEAIIGIVALVVTLPPGALALWRCCYSRRHVSSLGIRGLDHVDDSSGFNLSHPTLPYSHQYHGPRFDKGRGASRRLEFAVGNGMVWAAVHEV
ncbi:hypothetical protein V8F06_013816 [Rhypophila decipiens]